MTFHVKSNKNINHLFDDCICVCDNKRRDSCDGQYQFVTVGKLDAEKVTCKKCAEKIKGLVFREIGKAMERMKNED